MKIKGKHIIIFILQVVLSVLAFPAAFVIMAVFDIEMNSVFISANDGSTGPGWDAFLKIVGIFLIIIWTIFPLYKLIRYFVIKQSNNMNNSNS